MSSNNITMYLGAVISIVLLYIFFKIRRTLNFFKDRGIPYVKPYFIFYPKMLTLQEYWGDSWERIYHALAGHKIGGFHLGLLPFLMIRDPDYINNIFTSDFSSFQDRSFVVDEATNPLEGHLFFLKGSKWKFLRNKLSPIFTSGKLKWMYEEMHKCGDVFMDLIDRLSDGRDVDLKEQLARFTTDVIGSCAFGIEAEGLKNPDSKFRAMGKKFFEPSLYQGFVLLMRLASPEIPIKLKMKTTPSDVNDFFTSAIKDVMDYRQNSGKSRNDFVQLLLQLKQKGYVETESTDVPEKTSGYIADPVGFEKFEISDDLLAAQSFVFFVAGFETTSSTLHFTIYNFTINKEAQDKARKEVIEAKKKHGGITFDALKEMTYLEQCIAESLRLYPSVPNLNRECTKDYTFPDGTKIEKGTKIAIPIQALQRDPNYYPDPLEFRPERFDQPPPRGTYAPFGEGPRVCIGKRFAQVEMKMLLSRLLEKYSFEKSPLTKTPIEPCSSTTVFVPKHGIYVRIKKINDI